MINLMKGDCLEKMCDIEDGSIDLILTDPPYGTTACKWDSVIPLDEMWTHLKRLITPTGAIVMTASQPFTTTLIASNLDMFKYCWVWEKTKASNFVHSNFQPMKVHEDIVVFSHGGAAQGSKTPMTYNKQMTAGEPYSRRDTTGGNRVLAGGLNGVDVVNVTGQRPPKSIVKISNPSGKGHLHPTQKPVELMEYLINTYSNENDTVLDFTMGSGTTGVACKRTNRSFIGIEMDAEYFNIAESRSNDTILVGEDTGVLQWME
mgnify:CR=1 FL=1|jgi:site-specific DNA-methyltransferase (adenine-specific)